MTEIDDRATALTWARGCEQWNPCWSECWEAARDTIVDDDLDDWEKPRATIEQYRLYTARLGGETS